MTEGREEDNWNKSREAYENVQRSIVMADQLELYADVPRLIPEGVHPECLEQVMDIEPYTRIVGSSRKGSTPYEEDPGDIDELLSTNGKKRKRAAPGGSGSKSIPPDAPSGFQNVRDMLKTGGRKVGSAKSAKKPKPFDPNAGKDDDTDLDIEAGIHAPSRSTNVIEAKPKKNSTKRTTLAASDKPGKGSKKSMARKDLPSDTKPNLVPVTNKAQSAKRSFSERGLDDSDDENIEQGLRGTLSGPHILTPRISTPVLPHQTPEWWSPSPKRLRHEDTIELSSPSSGSGKSKNLPSLAVDLSPPLLVPPRETTQQLEDETNPSLVTRNQSPSFEIESSPTPAIKPASKTANDSYIILDDSTIDQAFVVEESLAESNDVSWLLAGSDDEPTRLDVVESSPVSSHKLQRGHKAKALSNMAPPAFSLHFKSAGDLLDDDSIDAPEPSFAIARVRPKKKRVVQADSSPMAMPPPSQRRLTRLQRHKSTSPSPPPQTATRMKKVKKCVGQKIARQFIDMEAAHSGEEFSAGSSGVDEPENEYDRNFLAEPGQTQVSPSYNQTLAYRQGLLTQAPSEGPQFNRGLTRRGAFGPSRPPQTLITSSPPTERSEPDDYEFGSFVVHDDAEITYDQDISEL